MQKNKLLKVGVVGATGMVGQAFMRLLEERKFPLAELRPFASENSQGKNIQLQNKSWPVQTLKQNCFDGLDLVFFSSGDEISKQWAPLAVQSGAFAVDNSAAFRMDAQTPLVVPEVNESELAKLKSPSIIANPNCSTIQLVVALKPLMDEFGIEDVKVCSYQAVSGAGQAAYDELLEQVSHPNEKPKAKNFPHPIAFNVIPQIGSFDQNGFCGEEIKIMRETRKILSAPQLKISAFTVRVPVLNAHSEAVWVTLNKKVTINDLRSCLQKAKGLEIQDEPHKSEYPLAIQASGKDPVYIGRIHQDPEQPNLWLMWIVADNIRKGAALNGIQIAERIFDI